MHQLRQKELRHKPQRTLNYSNIQTDLRYNRNHAEPPCSSELTLIEVMTSTFRNSLSECTEYIVDIMLSLAPGTLSFLWRFLQEPRNCPTANYFVFVIVGRQKAHHTLFKYI